jgi:hypothetical protein
VLGVVAVLGAHRTAIVNADVSPQKENWKKKETTQVALFVLIFPPYAFTHVI